MPFKSTSTSALDRAAIEAEGAFIDGRLKNIAFKHKQLRALFKILQENGDALLASVSGSSSSTYAYEIQHVLTIISEAISELPSDLVKAARQLRALVDSKAKQGRKQVGAGTVLIVADGAHPIASWAVPTVAAIMDGNPAIVTFSGEVNAVYQTLKRSLRRRIDQDAFHFLAQEPSVIHGWLKSGPPSMAGIISLGPLPGFDEASLPIKAFTVVTSSRSHSPVIIDQSIVPSGALQAMARSQGQHAIPHSIQDIAASISQAHHLVRGGNTAVRDKSRGLVSSGLPAYVLVHENVASLVLNALESTLPGQFRLRVQDLSAAEDILASSSLDYLPVFTVRSLDHAMDTVNNRLPGSAAAYVFGEERFGAYAAQNTRQRVVCVNDVPQRLAVLGAYASRKDFSITHERSFYVAKRPTREYDSSPDEYKKMTVAKLRQAGGFRIDFFGGSFLFAASIFLTCFLGGSGWAIYRGSLLALAKWRGL